jgi:hypothetical protein
MGELLGTYFLASHSSIWWAVASALLVAARSLFSLSSAICFSTFFALASTAAGTFSLSIRTFAMLAAMFYADSQGVRTRRSVQGYVTYYLVFTYRRNSLIPGVSGDEEVTVASELRQEAQDEAARIFGFDEDHASVLTSPQVAATLNEVFVRAEKSGR